MNILTRYLLREFIQNWLAVTTILLLILSANAVANLFRKVVSGKVSADALLPLVVAELLTVFATLIPLAVFLSLLMAMGRLSRDSEMIAMNACGWQLKNTYATVLGFGAIGAAVVAVMAFWLAPQAADIEAEVKRRLQLQPEVTGLSAGRFNESKDGQAVLYARGQDPGGRLLDVFFRQQLPTGEQLIVLAKSAHTERQSSREPEYFVFHDGLLYRGNAGAVEFEISKFENHGVLLELATEAPLKLDVAARMTTSLLGDDDSEAIAEFHWRIAQPLAVLILALWAVPLSRSRPRSGRFSQLALGILLYLLYANSLALGRDWIASGQVAAWAGLWGVHLGALLIWGMLIIAPLMRRS